MAASSAYSRSVRWYWSSWITGTITLKNFHNVVDDAVEQIRGSHITLSNSAGHGEPVEQIVVDTDTCGCSHVRNMRRLFTGKTNMMGGTLPSLFLKTRLGGVIKCPLAIGKVFVWLIFKQASG